MKTETRIVTTESKIEKSVVPKPTKKEIIEALTQLKISEIKAEIQKRKEKNDAIISETKKKVLDWFAENFKDQTPRIIFPYRADPRIEFVLPDLPNEIRNEVDKCAQLDERYCIDTEEIRRQIRKKVMGVVSESTQDRIDKMISDPETKSALKEMLQKLKF